MKLQSVKPIFVLAGGFGTRLRSAVSNVPKPLAPVEGKPFLQHLLENWASQGATNIIFLTYYKADKIKSFISSVSRDPLMSNLKFNCLVETSPLGTGGALHNAVTELNVTDSFLVANADTWLGDGLYQLNETQPNSIAVVKVDDCSRYGSVLFNKRNITSFVEKTECSGPGFINAGLYHLAPEIFENVSKNKVFSLENDIFPTMVEKHKLQSKTLRTEFVDIEFLKITIDFAIG